MFDPSAPHIIILLVVVLLLFGSTRLPGAAKALGQSMHIFRKSVKGEDSAAQAGETKITQVTTALPPGPAAGQAAQAAPAASQQELRDIQRRLDDLQRRTAGDDGTIVDGVPLSEAQRNLQQRS
jgi:sec-independent protein translocase protein TatA